MNANNPAKRILVYGDSLTYGRQAGANARLAPDVRFTGVLQQLLGDDTEVIEEGLRARMLSGENPHYPERNGLVQFGPIVASHLPLDAVVIALGTNDVNRNPAFNPQSFAEAVRQYADKLKDWANFFGVSVPTLLLVLPPDIDESSYDEGMIKIFGPGANERVTQLRQEMRRVAKDLNLPVVDASEHCAPAPEDGIHLDPENNRRLAQALHKALTELL